MKIKTDELQGAALDWAVAKCERIEFTYEDHPHHEMFDMHYSTNWAQGGPIIEREGIGLQRWNEEHEWAADIGGDFRSRSAIEQYGDTPLIAAMRCYVAGKLGSEIDIPEELK